MRTTFIILIVLLYSVVAFGQEHKERTSPTPQTGAPAAQPQQGAYPLRYSSPEGRYIVSLPAEPKLSTQNVTTPDGKPLTQHLAMVPDGNGMLMIAYFDYGSDVVFSLDQGRDGMLKSINGTLLDEHSMSLGGAPGRQIKIVASTADGLVFIDRARFYDVKPRVYVLQCIVPKSVDSPAAAERCDQFFDSFRVRTTP